MELLWPAWVFGNVNTWAMDSEFELQQNHVSKLCAGVILFGSHLLAGFCPLSSSFKITWIQL